MISSIAILAMHAMVAVAVLAMLAMLAIVVIKGPQAIRAPMAAARDRERRLTRLRRCSGMRTGHYGRSTAS